MEDVYIIVETKSDKTVHIAEKYQANIYLRQDYKDKQRKGYALDECLKDILSQNKHYDLYFIFDADNIVSNNYFEEMLKTYHEGYEIGTGYRNIKNTGSNVFKYNSFISAAKTLFPLYLYIAAKL